MATVTTGSQMRELFPHALDGYVQAITQGGRFFDQYGVTTPLRLAHFLAQCAAETGGFMITEEDGDYSAARLLEVFPRYFTPAQARAYAGKPQMILARAYGGRLGNGGELTRDGWTYRGRGMIQLTGRENYARRSAIAGVDLAKDPGKAADCFISLKIALQEWIDLGLNEWADRGPTHAAVLACSRAINCGSPTAHIQPNGMNERSRWFDEIWRKIGDGAAAVPVSPAANGVLEEGETGDAVKAMQESLAKLRYPVGAPDGIFGELTKAAVLAFQHREQLAGEPGKWIMGAYDEALAKAQPFALPWRSNLNATALLNMGDTHTIRTSFGKKVAALTGSAALLAQGAQSIDVSDLPNIASGARGIVEPIAEALRWASQSLPLALGFGCAALWVLFHRLQQQRLANLQGKDTP